MPDEPKFFPPLPSEKPPLSGDGNGYTPHFAPPSETAHPSARKTNLRRALFFLVVASLLILGDRVGRVSELPNSNSGRPWLQDVTLVLHPRTHVQSQLGVTVLFRLSNVGNHSVFYAVRSDTNVPTGQIVAQASPSSEWMTLSATSQQQSPTEPESIHRNLAWIEMPPGGWIDGEFYDCWEAGGEHAYAIFLKPDRDGDEARIVSQPYHFNSN